MAGHDFLSVFGAIPFKGWIGGFENTSSPSIIDFECDKITQEYHITHAPGVVEAVSVGGKSAWEKYLIAIQVCRICYCDMDGIEGLTEPISLP